MITVPLSCVLCVIINSGYFLNANALRVFHINNEETILAFNNEDIKIECKSDLPITYCGFVNPSGRRFSFTGSTVNDGKCVQEIKATVSDSGEWKCHIGMKPVGLETIKRIQVRIVDQLAAIQPNITAKRGKSVNLSCATTRGYVPLSYCRFEPPNGKSFSIDASVNVSAAILGKYHFPYNSSLDRGDCAVAITKLSYEDAGEWTCGAGFEDGNEYTDKITIEVEGMHIISMASAAGLTFGGILIVVTLAILGYVAWKQRRLLAGVPQVESIEVQEIGLRERPPTTPLPERSLPSVIVQSPSDPSSSPLLHSPQSRE